MAGVVGGGGDGGGWLVVMGGGGRGWLVVLVGVVGGAGEVIGCWWVGGMVVVGVGLCLDDVLVLAQSQTHKNITKYVRG